MNLISITVKLSTVKSSKCYIYFIVMPPITCSDTSFTLFQCLLYPLRKHSFAPITDISMKHGRHFCTLLYGDDDTAVGYQMEGAVVVYLTDDMIHLSLAVFRNKDVGLFRLRMVKEQCTFPNLPLLPPMEC